MKFVVIEIKAFLGYRTIGLFLRNTQKDMFEKRYQKTLSKIAYIFLSIFCIYPGVIEGNKHIPTRYVMIEKTNT